MTDPTHLIESAYTKGFPTAVDEFPAPVNEEHYIDAWLLNTLYSSILATEQYLIDHKGNIEAPAGADVIGDEGSLEIPIPAARYTGYETALAWDSNLLEENIAAGVVIFGVPGSLVAGGGSAAITPPSISVIAEDPVTIGPTALAIDSSTPTISTPTVTAA